MRFFFLFALLQCATFSDAALPTGDAAKCEYTASDGSFYDLTPLHILNRGKSEAREKWLDNADPRPKLVDRSVADLPYWSSSVEGQGTLAFNPCGAVQNSHKDCPMDHNGDPNNVLVQLLPVPAADPVDSESHRKQHCVGFGTSDSLRFEDAEQPNAGLRMTISGGSAGRSAVINLVCGKSTGEITAMTVTGIGPNARAKVTFVSKYACPKQSDPAAEANKRRQKEADRRARQKLAENLEQLRQARLLHPQPRQHRPTVSAADRMNKRAKAMGVGNTAQKAGLERLKDLGAEAMKAAGVNERKQMRGPGAAVRSGAAAGGKSAALAEVDIYRQLLSKKKEREQSVGMDSAASALADDDEKRSANEESDEDPEAVRRREARRTEGLADAYARGQAEQQRAVIAEELREEEEALQKQAAESAERARRSKQESERHNRKRSRVRTFEEDENAGRFRPPEYSDDEEFEDDAEFDRMRSRSSRRKGRRAVYDGGFLARGDQSVSSTGTLLLLLVLVVVSALLGYVWYRAQRAKRPPMVFEYATPDEYARKATNYTYDNFVSQVTAQAAQQRSNAATTSVTEDEYLDDDDVLGGSLLPPAPSSELRSDIGSFNFAQHTASSLDEYISDDDEEEELRALPSLSSGATAAEKDEAEVLMTPGTVKKRK